MKNKFIIQIAMALLLSNSATFAQVTQLSNNSTLLPEFLGWNNGVGNTPKHLDIRNQWPSIWDINFFTNGNPGTQRMTILGNNGLVGIGDGYVPTFRLDVWNDINIAPQAANFINNGYRIGGNLVLYIPGVNNTFVGRSGNNTANPGNNNTYLGFDAGT